MATIAKISLPKIEDEEREFEIGYIYSISGPVIIAEKLSGTSLYELVRVGHDQLLGEVIKLKGEQISIQMFEETSRKLASLSVGDPVIRTKKQLSVELGPGIMKNLFDGLQRPLQTIYNLNETNYIPRGVNTPPLDKDASWYFEPQVRVGDHITGGDIFGKVVETILVTHWIMLPPFEMGTVVSIAPPGNYTLMDYVLDIEFQGKVKKFTMLQIWPVRNPRPVSEILQPDRPLLVGLRVLDTLFPCAQGGTCAITGAWGAGKNTLTYFAIKSPSSDCSIYVGCGERSSEVAELMHITESVAYFNGRRESLINRTALVANTSNMPVVAREASIYTGITLAEYYRDMGYNVSMVAESISRWAEAMVEVYGKLGDIPNLGSTLGKFYSRAGKATCLGNPKRMGSVTILTTVSPPGGDFSEPVASTALSMVQTFWALDTQLARRKHFPSVNWNHSFTNNYKALDPFYDELDPEFVTLRTKIREILQKEDDLNDMIQIVGKDGLPHQDRVTIEVAQLVRCDFLQQNIFLHCENFCPLYKMLWMMRIFTTFYKWAQQAADKQITWSIINTQLSDLIYKISSMKFKELTDGEQVVIEHFKSLHREVEYQFHNLIINHVCK